MKKIYAIILFIFFMLPFKVNAANMSLNLSCPAQAKAGATVNCTISGTVSNGKLKGITTKLSYTNGLSFVSFTPSSSWANYYSGASGFSIGNVAGVSGTVTFGTLKVKVPANAAVNSSYSVTVSQIDASDENNNSFTASNKTATIKVLSGNNNLSGLKLSNANISFSTNTLNYSATINATSTVISASLQDSSASFVSGYGARTINLSYGTHNYYVKVKAANGDIKTYTLTITRPDNRNTDNSLKSLSVSEGKIKFSPTTLTYELSVEQDVTSIMIEAVTNDSKASLVTGFGSRTVNLKYGNNTVLVKVRAENGSEKTYTLNIFRSDGRDGNNYLKSVEVNDVNLKFDKEKFEYNIKVPYELEKLDFSIVLDSDKSTFDINGNELKVGDNVVTILVTAENEQTRKYIINVLKLNEGEMIPNADLENIIIKGHNINFSKEKLRYLVTTDDSSPLDISVELSHKDSIYKIIGNKNLNNKDEITIMVISSDLEIKEYVIEIVSNKREIPIIVIIVICILLLIILFQFKRINKYKNMNNKKDKKSKIYLNKEIDKKEIEENLGVENPSVEPIDMDELISLNEENEKDKNGAKVITQKSDVSFLDE